MSIIFLDTTVEFITEEMLNVLSKILDPKIPNYWFVYINTICPPNLYSYRKRTTENFFNKESYFDYEKIS